jgi:D-inositol-3-phosphate glycosyltransferase
MNIAIVGPLAHTRGGIAVYTHALAQRLAPQDNVRVYAHPHRYPAWLYPGNSAAVPGMDTSEGDIDPIKPASWHRALDQMRDEQTDVLVLQWWSAFQAPMVYALAREARRRAMCDVVLICHALTPPDRHLFSQLAAKHVLAQADRIIALCTHDADTLANLLPGKPVRAVRLPAPPVPEAVPTCADARIALGLHPDVPVALHFGLQREYKGLRVLLQAFEQIRKSLPLTLIVAGEAWRDAKIRTEIMWPGLVIETGYLPDARVSQLFAATDVTVLPYLRGTASGVAELSYAHGRPVIGTRVSGLTDAVRHGVDGWLVNPGDATALAATITGFFTSGSRAALQAAALDRNQFSCTWSDFLSAVRERQVIRAGA